jgi:3-hydroxybutyrate dehydrogenase
LNGSNVTNKTALITGSTAGLGLAIAEALATKGVNIVMTGLGDASEIERRRHVIESSSGSKVVSIPADLRDRVEIESLVSKSYDIFGSVDILVNNAVSRHVAAIEDFGPGEWDQDIAVNLTAAFDLIRLTIKGMKAAGWGRIINLSSNLGLFGAPNRASYVTTKTALIGLTRAVAAETAGTDITCNAICPSALLGENADRLITQIEREKGVSRDAAMREFLANRKRNRFVTTVPALISFLCSEDGKDMTGAAIPVDLGSSAGQPASVTYIPSRLPSDALASNVDAPAAPT